MSLPTQNEECLSRSLDCVGACARRLLVPWSTVRRRRLSVLRHTVRSASARWPATRVQARSGLRCRRAVDVAVHGCRCRLPSCADQARSVLSQSGVRRTGADRALSGDECDGGVCRFAPRQCPAGVGCPTDLPLQCVADLAAKPQCTGKFFGQPCESSDGKAGACDALPRPCESAVNCEPDFVCKVGDKPLTSSCAAPGAGCLVADALGLCSSKLVCRSRNGPSGECRRGLKDGDACENGVCRFSPRPCADGQACQTDLVLLCYSDTNFLPCSRAMTACVTEKGAKGLCSDKLVCESAEGPSDTSGFANVLQLSAAAIMVSFTTLQ
jgi:hypothetical protein